MSRDDLVEKLEVELELFRKSLKMRGFPIVGCELDVDDFNVGEPFLHIHLELDDEAME